MRPDDDKPGLFDSWSDVAITILWLLVVGAAVCVLVLALVVIL